MRDATTAAPVEVDRCYMYIDREREREMHRYNSGPNAVV